MARCILTKLGLYYATYQFTKFAVKTIDYVIHTVEMEKNLAARKNLSQSNSCQQQEFFWDEQLCFLTIIHQRRKLTKKNRKPTPPKLSSSNTTHPNNTD